MDYAALSTLDFLPYIDADGQLPDSLQGKVGVYAIFDRDQVLQYIGYSRDVFLSLRQHLVRQPQQCHWVKVQTIDRPSRTALEAMRESWIAENGSMPTGNGTDAAIWNQPIDVRTQMTIDERTHYNAAIDELSQMKCLKNVARRVEAEVLSVLKKRGVQAEIRFNPKLKEEGLLDLK
ncbi:MAG: GIY-YIG nuclease family protein [Scytolyngbya sp. HA4215-MV1]|jgi:hypothetical protein|nr:GIY-YIG nuclease family protein [Scytolyngbya sp. HA4215-MV1]